MTPKKRVHSCLRIFPTPRRHAKTGHGIKTIFLKWIAKLETSFKNWKTMVYPTTRLSFSGQIMDKECLEVKDGFMTQVRMCQSSCDGPEN